jgi:hypothetical protein
MLRIYLPIMERGTQGVRSKVRKRLWLAASLLVVIALLAGGCAEPVPNPQPAPEVLPAEHPNGMKSLRWLTDAEKERVIEIAFNTPEAARARETYGLYETSLRWVAIVWHNYGAELWGLDYECIDEGVPANVPESAEFYSQVVFDFGKPPQLELGVAIDPDTGKVAYVEGYPLKILPGCAK